MCPLDHPVQLGPDRSVALTRDRLEPDAINDGDRLGSTGIGEVMGLRQATVARGSGSRLRPLLPLNMVARSRSSIPQADRERLFNFL